MISRLRLTDYKSFEDAELRLGPFTLLIGTNASGKSNIRDAFRFLHGVGRGYSLIEILAEKIGEGGERQWAGVRGALAGQFRHSSDSFRVEATIQALQATDSAYDYSIEVNDKPWLVGERLVRVGTDEGFDTSSVNSPGSMGPAINARVSQGQQESIVDVFRRDTPVVSQIGESYRRDFRFFQSHFIHPFVSMRFPEMEPDAMRQPSFPGQPLGDRGENISSVLQRLWSDQSGRNAVLHWLNALTPLDVQDLKFNEVYEGRVLASLIDPWGYETSAINASDGTLRFLALLAMLHSRPSPQFVFLEEIETGIHPTRLHLLSELIEHTAANGGPQVVATTHSPHALRALSQEALSHVHVCYRLRDSSSTKICRLLDIANIRDLLTTDDLGRLFESGWVEDALEFTRAEEAA
jgi:predicted ATPase